MAEIAVKAAGIFTESAVKRDACLLIEDDKICGFADYGEVQKRNISVREYPGAYVLPGLIDTHIHGAAGCDTMDASPEALDKIGAYLLSEGTTAWMPTTVTAPLENICRALQNAAACQKRKKNAARILGAFVEGPYITAEHKGAHPKSCIRGLNEDDLLKIAGCGCAKSIIIAPEKDSAAQFTKLLTEKLRIKVSLGHSSADYKRACECFDAGADAGVHTFCGMEPFHHRSPNLVGAVLTRDDVYAELIADGIHVSVPAMQLLLRCKPKDKVILISDAIRAAGMPDGRYMLGVMPFSVKDGVARVDSGSIAGSTATLLKEVKFLIDNLHINPVDAVNMASLNPAKRYRLDDVLGSVKTGKKADFIIVSPDFKVLETWLDGKTAFSRTGRSDFSRS